MKLKYVGAKPKVSGRVKDDNGVAVGELDMNRAVSLNI